MQLHSLGVYRGLEHNNVIFCTINVLCVTTLCTLANFRLIQVLCTLIFAILANLSPTLSCYKITVTDGASHSHLLHELPPDVDYATSSMDTNFTATFALFILHKLEMSIIARAEQ